MTPFPLALDSPLARDIARAMIDGFNRHYTLFRAESARAKHRFETCDWHAQQRAQRERIEFYDLRVRECHQRLEREFKAGAQPMEIWQQVKLHYIGLLVEHKQPELAETFFNSVTTQILQRHYFHNHFIFVRPAISTEYLETDDPQAPPTFRAFYPPPGELQSAVRALLQSFGLRCHFEDIDRDAARVAAAMQHELSELGDEQPRANFQLQALSGLFYRNKGAYLVGKLINGFREVPFALPILHRAPGTLYVDAALFGEEDLLLLFSFSRAYFMVDMEIPSAYVQFLRSLMPRKPRAEIYNALGLAKQGKNLFYRDMLWHLRHSTDCFRIAPGIKGMVMLVFDLPSFPYVFKIIRDHFPPAKDTSRDQVRGKYQLVKRHDRVGRMADTMEFSLLAFPRARFHDELIAEIQQSAPSQLEISDRDGDGQAEVIIRHAYIERRMIPLNLYLQQACAAAPTDAAARARLEHAVIEYGNAIKDLVAANIFPGDMLWKNFGVTRHGKVVFYDYDEIEYLTHCNFRRVPPPRNEEDEHSGEIWYPVAKNDVFPETFTPFLLGNPLVRAAFMRHHADLLEPDFWQQAQDRIRHGEVLDFFPYGVHRRFDFNGGVKGASELADPVAARADTPAGVPDDPASTLPAALSE
jgi:isocitrate dehydrogenase kinase/phosphatase